MRLDERLRAVAAMVPPGCRVADIGSDHAYLAMTLWTERKAAMVIATDKNTGPCDAARRTLKAAGLAGVIPVRQGDGLWALAPGEVEIACICGMGGELILSILESAPQILTGLGRLILQPMSDVLLLRRWLYGNGWHIMAESLVEAEGRLYEILAAVPGEEPMPPDGMLLIGPCLWRDKPPYLRRHIEELLERRQRVAMGMERSEVATNTEKYRRMRREIEFLEASLIW